VRLTSLLLAAACFVLVAATPAVRVSGPAAPPRVPPTLTPAAPEPPATTVVAGDPAPDVAWEGPESRRLHLRDLRAQGSVLLVFEPGEAQLQALERDRERLLDLGVVPAAVLDRSPSSLRALARRLALHFTLIPDRQRVIASQFNVLDPATLRAVPAWFVVDRSGKVRALDRGKVPEGGYTRLVSAALVLPARDATLPGSTR